MEELILRVTEIIDICWKSFSAKVGGGLININKEASMQLHFAYILKNTLDLAVHHQDETVSIELETAIPVNGRLRECDIVVHISKAHENYSLPIEMKCYRTLASSGNKRGAIDIFMKDLYEDMQLLESYSKLDNFINGIQLTMTDYRPLAFPNIKKGKNWAYDTSHGHLIDGGIHLTVPIGGKDCEIKLEKSYDFRWSQIGEYYFLKLVGNTKEKEVVGLNRINYA